MGNDQQTRMGATFEVWATPEEGEWPKRDAVPFEALSISGELSKVIRGTIARTGWTGAPQINQPLAEHNPKTVFDRMAESLIRDGVAGMKDGRLITADEMYIGQRPAEVTPEMMASAMSAFAETYLVCTLGAAEDALIAIIRAALAQQPVELVSPAERQVEKAYCYLRGLFEICAPNSTPLPDLIGLCTQIDNVIAGLRAQALPSDDRGNPFHFVMDRDGAGPQLWMRTALDDWFLVRPGWSLGCEAPEVHAVATNAQPDRLPAGYRYLGPAWWRPTEPLVSDAESALIRERDAWIAEYKDANAHIAGLDDVIETLARERDEALECAKAESRRHGQALLERDEARAELMAAHDKLARQAKALGNAANTIAALTPHAESTPAPIANAIRDHDTDRRRMGPI